jgi:hypothetical protein
MFESAPFRSRVWVNAFEVYEATSIVGSFWSFPSLMKSLNDLTSVPPVS